MMHDETLLQNRGHQQTSRRRLLRACGVASVAVLAVVLAKDPIASAQQTFPQTHVNHLSYNAADFVKSRDFYIDLFGMRIAWDDGKGSALEFGDLKLPNGIYIRPVGNPGEEASVGHIAYGMDDFMANKMAIKAEIERRGMEARADGYAGWSVNDPAGYMVQFTPVKSDAMYPGASPMCPAPGPSDKCKAGYEAGTKNLASLPKPSGTGFTAYAISPIDYHVPDVAKAKDFYTNVMGMKVLSESGDEVVLGFGENTLNLKKADGDKASTERFGLLIEGYDDAKVNAELDRRGLNPQRAGKMGWSIKDPAGYTIEVSGGAR